MDKQRYTVDEKRFDNQSINHHDNSADSFADRNSAISGYKKLLILVCVFAVICFFRTKVIDRVVVDGNSMNPTFCDGDVTWTKKFDFTLNRNQVVIAKVENRLVIKRVIGLPNETVQIIDGKVHVNGKELENDYGYPTKNYGCAVDEIKLNDDEYFIMGDNRDNSMDSRRWGAIKRENIKGVVIYRIFPFWKIGRID